MKAVLATVTTVLLLTTVAAIEEEQTGAPAGMSVPQRLQPYADEKRVKEGASAVIGLLQSAKFELVKGGLFASCNTKEVHLFYRGFHLAQAGFYLFASMQETGRFDYKNPTKTEPPRALVDVGTRNTLVQVWPSERLQRLLTLSSSMAGWPRERRSDIVVFLRKVREFRPYFNRLRLAGAQLEQYHQRRADPNAIPYWRFYLPMWGGLEKMKAQMRQILPGRIMVDFDGELRQLVNRVRGPKQPAISECYEAGQGFKMTLGGNPAIVSEKLFLPTYYMVRFWERRDSEGTSDLADMLMSMLIAAIENPGAR